jgi:hypothetical protein
MRDLRRKVDSKGDIVEVVYDRDRFEILREILQERVS